RRAFNLERVLAEASVLSIPFWGTPLLPAVAVVTPAVGVLRLRDAFIYPGEGTPAEATADALVSASAIVASQLLLWLWAPSLMMEPALLVRGTVMGILSVALLRASFALTTPHCYPVWQRSDIVVSQCCEVMFFILLAFPFISAVWRWFDGNGCRLASGGHQLCGAPDARLSLDTDQKTQ